MCVCVCVCLSVCVSVSVCVCVYFSPLCLLNSLLVQKLHRLQFSSVQYSPLTDWVVTGTEGAIQLISSSGLFCRRLWSDYSKQVGGQLIRIRLKIAEKCGLYLDIFSCVEMNVFRSFFAFRLEMHVRCDNQYKTGADRENILRQLRLFECMGI